MIETRCVKNALDDSVFDSDCEFYIRIDQKSDTARKDQELRCEISSFSRLLSILECLRLSS